MKAPGNKTLTVVGGGLVGAAVAYGAARMGASVCVLDQGDVAIRASRGNFGLVSVQGKGLTLPHYARWTRDAVKMWPALHKELLNVTGVDSCLQLDGGFWVGFSDAEVTAQAEVLQRIDREAGDIPFHVLDRVGLKQYFPGIGPTVVGGTFCPIEGHANPLMLLRALHEALRQKGADIITGVDVSKIQYNSDNGHFDLIGRGAQRWRSERLVLAAGLGNARLAPQVGLNAPMVASRGQILITERLKPFMRYPMMKIRQTNEGSIQIGSTVEDVGINEGTSTKKIESMARGAVATFPALAQARIVRAWGALRPMTPDGHPIYEMSKSCPGAYLVTCHSGVTLAAAHCFVIGEWVGGFTDTPPEFDVFRSDRLSGLEKSISHVD